MPPSRKEKKITLWVSAHSIHAFFKTRAASTISAQNSRMKEHSHDYDQTDDDHLYSVDEEIGPEEPEAQRD